MLKEGSSYVESVNVPYDLTLIVDEVHSDVVYFTISVKVADSRNKMMRLCDVENSYLRSRLIDRATELVCRLVEEHYSLQKRGVGAEYNLEKNLIGASPN